MMKLDVIEFGITLGCIWGSSVLMLTLMSRVSRRAEKVVRLFSKVYIGCRKTLLGSFIGAVWGFFDGAVSGLLIAWIYNKIISQVY